MGGSRDYLDQDSFTAASMGVQWQRFEHPAYPQCGAAPFIQGLSAVDLLFNCGARGRDLFWQRAASDELLAA
jgi:hypothetical protein